MYHQLLPRVTSFSNCSERELLVSHLAMLTVFCLDLGFKQLWPDEGPLTKFKQVIWQMLKRYIGVYIYFCSDILDYQINLTD